jgi:hypothetical protein
MPTLDVTFTWALPVNAAKLTAHMQAYLDTLPALNTLRACNRFGKGPQCYISKLPVELVQSIAQYRILEVREEKHEECISLMRCCEDTCTIYDHHSEEKLLDIYYDFMECASTCSDDFDENPGMEVLSEWAAECNLDQSQHYDNMSEWDDRLKTYLTDKRSLLQKHFGIDMWFSKVCLGSSRSFMAATETTVAYLTLPNRVESAKEWKRDMSEDGFESTNTGYGFAVELDRRATSREIQNFKRAMKILDLDVFVHETQKQVEGRGLSLASSEGQQAPVANGTTTSFPRPMLLVRNHIEGE